MSYLRDPIWTVIGIAIVTVLTVVIYRLQQQRKALAYSIISHTPLLNVNEKDRDDISILYKRKRVSDVSFLIVKIFNAGNVPIEVGDFDRPITLNFGETAGLLKFDVVETVPDNIRAMPTSVGTKLVLEPLLLNRGDSITLTALLTGCDGDIKVDARIIGVRDISKISSAELSKEFVLQFRALKALLLVGLFIAFVFLSVKVKNANTIAAVIGFLMPIIWGVMSLKYGFFRNSKVGNVIDIIVIFAVNIFLISFLLVLSYLSR
jgi:hypothetical protein